MLAREQMICTLLGDINFDLTVCQLEHWNHKEYILRLKQEIDNILNKLKD